MDELMLERLMERAAAITAYPATPALRGRVIAAIAQPATARATRRPAFVLAALAIVALALAVALAVPSSRSAIAEFFGVEGAKVERLPTPHAGVTPTPFPVPAELGTYAQPSSLADAQAAIGFAPALVPGEQDPSVYLARYPGESVAILSYGMFDLWEMRGRDLNVGKGVPAGVTLLDVAINGRPAYWISGGPHIVTFFDDLGRVPGSERTVARDTLIWRTGRALYRMETTLPRLEAMRVAETLP